MRLIKFILSLVILFSIASCTTTENIKWNTALLKNKFNEKPLLFIACVRCGCMIDALNKIFKKDSTLLGKFVIYADTSCIRNIIFRKKVNHSSQTLLDSVYDENYSVILFKKQNNSIKHYLIKTEESTKMSKILADF